MSRGKHGGSRENAGRKPGPRKVVALAKTDIRAEKAREDGHLLPHELLLRAANGECFIHKKLHITMFRRGPRAGQEKSRQWVDEEYWPSFTEQVDAAKAAAPYYSPKLATQIIGTNEQTSTALAAVMKQLSSQLPG